MNDLNNTGLSPFQILREDLSSMRQEFNSAIRSLVTSDLFRDEQRRVDDKFTGLGREIGDLRKEFDSALAAITAAEQAKLKERLQEQQERDKMRRNQTLQWVALVLSPVAVIVVNDLLVV